MVALAIAAAAAAATALLSLPNPRPHPQCPFPDTRVCQHVQGGIVRFHNGVPVVRKKESLRLGWDNSSIPNKVDEIKAYLELEAKFEEFA